MATVKVDKSNFKSDVLDSNVPVVVDFWAEWCGPCKMIGPSLEEIANEMAGKVKITKLNVDENQDLAAQYGVRSIPTLDGFQERRTGGDEGRRAAQERAQRLDQERKLSLQAFQHEPRTASVRGFFVSIAALRRFRAALRRRGRASRRSGCGRVRRGEACRQWP